MSIAIFDIDGVLADATRRQHHVRARPKDWDAFFAEVGEDPVIAAGRDLLLEAAGSHEVVLVSGRPERTRADTVSWLVRNGFGERRLVLRADDDWRVAAVAKLELVRSVGPPADVALIIDDDASVVEALSGQGYPARLFVA